jgi:hypothetical protein
MAGKHLLSTTSTTAAPPTTGQPITGRQTPTAPTERPITITGRELRLLLHGKSNKYRAAAAACFVNGTLPTPEHLSPVQAARLCNVNVGYVTASLGCTVKHGPRDSTIEKINKVVRKFGVEALMAGCDRATAPAANGKQVGDLDDVVI